MPLKFPDGTLYFRLGSRLYARVPVRRWCYIDTQGHLVCVGEESVPNLSTLMALRGAVIMEEEFRKGLASNAELPE